MLDLSFLCPHCWASNELVSDHLGGFVTLHCSRCGENVGTIDTLQATAESTPNPVDKEDAHD
jgi:transcription elongation factor Elf1